MRKMMAVCVGLVLVFAFGVGACKKKESQPVPQAPGMSPHGGPGMAPGMAPHGPMGQGMSVPPMGEIKVVVPEDLKGKWSGVKIAVTDKTTQKTTEYTMKLHGDFNVPNSDLKVTVGDFIPDFKMEGPTITSASNNPNNPAVGIKVMEKGKQVFPAPEKKWGWLYGRPEFRAMHPFDHPKYSLTLIGGVKKS